MDHRERSAAPARSRRPTLARLINLAGLFLLATTVAMTTQARAADVWVLELDGAIGPATSDYITRNLANAEDAGAELFIIRMDTPGGLDSSMRDIIKAILDADVPVATWVAPNGSRAASAGTYILYASHVAAMAPATNLGAATPVAIGGGSSPLPIPDSAPNEAAEPDAATSPPASGAADETGDATGTKDSGQADSAERAPPPGTAMERKSVNDAVAYIRGLAELRGRNADWAEAAVRQAESLSAPEALQRGVIDLIAEDLDTLLQAVDGRRITIKGSDVTLHTAAATVTRVQPDWRNEFLALITDPNVAYILLMVGIYGLILEFYNPGVGVAGVTGVICLLLGAYALQMLPVSYAGLALMLLGISLMVAEAFAPSFGVFGVGGVIAFAFGSVLLMDTALPAFQISLPIIAAFVVSSLGILVFGIGAALRARGEPTVSGSEAMTGATAVALGDFQDSGRVRVMGEVWRARSVQPVHDGDIVRVTRVDGLTVEVQAPGNNDAAPDTEPA